MTSCSTQKQGGSVLPGIARDIHSYSNPDRVLVRHLNLDLKVVFEQQTIQGTAILTIEQSSRGAKQLILDSRALQIDETEVSPDGLKYQEARFSIGRIDKILGAPLRIDIAPRHEVCKDSLFHGPDRNSFTVARSGANGGQATSLSLHSVPGDPRAQLDSGAGFTGRSRHL